MACRLSMLLWLRRGSDHPWLADAFWKEWKQLLGSKEKGEMISSHVNHKLDKFCSAKIEELVKIVLKHPGEHIVSGTVLLYCWLAVGLFLAVQSKLTSTINRLSRASSIKVIPRYRMISQRLAALQITVQIRVGHCISPHCKATKKQQSVHTPI